MILLSWDSSVSVNKIGHDTTSSLNTKRKRSNIKKKEFLSLLVTLTGEDSSLDGSTISNSLIRVDTLVERLAIEELLKHLLDFRDSSRTTDENDLMNLVLGALRILEHIFNRRHTLSKEVHAKFLELSSCQLGGVILTLSKGLTLNRGLSGRRENSLSFLTLSSKSSDGSLIAANVDTKLLFDISHKVVKDFLIEVLTTEMGVTIGSLNLENTFLDSKKRNIESTTSKIEDEDVLLLR